MSSMAADAEVFGEEPADLGTFITSPRYLGLFRLSPVQYEIVRHVDSVIRAEDRAILARSCDRRITRYWAQEFSEADEISLEVGKACGKDEVSRCIVLRAAYLLLCLADPADYFGLMPNSSIHLLNVAVSAAQAERAFFAPLVRYVRREGESLPYNSRAERICAQVGTCARRRSVAETAPSWAAGHRRGSPRPGSR